MNQVLCPSCRVENEEAATNCSACQAHLELKPGLLLRRELAQGMARTTIATLDGQEVIVKELDISELEEWKHLDLFRREAAVLRRLNHPAIPRYIDDFADEQRGHFYLVQTYIDAPNLEEVLEERHFDEAEVLDMARRLLGALEYLHGLQPPVIHRDIKPANILLGRDGQVSLVDFGTVRAVLQQKGKGGTTVVGTLGYMAPEQFYGQATPASDFYGLGATMLRLLSRAHPADLPHDGLDIDISQALAGVSPTMRGLIIALMQVKASARPQQVGQVRALMTGVEPRRANHQRQGGQQGAPKGDLLHAFSGLASAVERSITSLHNPDWARRQQSQKPKKKVGAALDDFVGTVKKEAKKAGAELDKLHGHGRRREKERIWKKKELQELQARKQRRSQELARVEYQKLAKRGGSRIAKWKREPVKALGKALVITLVLYYLLFLIL